MLNEERVKHMIKLADYETKGGSEDIKVSAYFKKDYINLNTLLSVLWMTAAYVLSLVAIWLAVRDLVAAPLTQVQVSSIIILIIGIYFMLLVAYLAIARRFFKKKHARAYFRVKKFRENLAVLEAMYEKEEQDAETV